MGTVDVSRHGSIAVVTLNQPGKRNAMTDDMWRAVPTVMADLDRDVDVTAIVLTGAGESFCAGSDISSLDELGHAESPVNAELAIARSPKPVVAAIEGPCFGGGLELAVACDLRIASESATFSVPPARLGIVYPVSATQRMIDLMGPAVTKEMLLTAVQLDAARALRVGLVNRVVDHGNALPIALQLTEHMSGLSQLTIRASKEIVDGLVARDLSAETAIAWVSRAATGPDLAEGKRAFTERRAPVFSWRPA
ncbi:enoyl-CoA hydratase/isomerase family protein [Tessaracoccus flavus]|jgi:enoyl-CoA hydratase/carnithine racemase|uniref:Uncharacterized protein n=1 Tax=Tessaracoccus flavus TaxID=1610493 RepID=A0A1Q2CCQ8_9ACTN|nr:enoyl-CoA hydratase-related protein [Tessaracoccus flavus]AQP43886.1 hypothetical protein RPIT_02875 [Tessaracoccus flavus]SDY27429.1 Enoyl-CoA hydratase/carnithine racemase [Tessaracoccus flavus]